MEAFEFLKENKRMCTVNKDCYGCPLNGTTCSISPELSEEQMINIVNKTEQWSKENPIITNSKKFEEVFGLPAHCMIDQDAQWWDEPYKEPEHEL